MLRYLTIGEVEKLTYLIRLLKNSKACVCVIYTASGQIDQTKKWISVSWCADFAPQSGLLLNTKVGGG